MRVAKIPEACSVETWACDLTTNAAPLNFTIGSMIYAGFGPLRTGSIGMAASRPAPLCSSAHTRRYSGCGGVTARGVNCPTKSSTPSSAYITCAVIGWIMHARRGQWRTPTHGFLDDAAVFFNQFGRHGRRKGLLAHVNSRESRSAPHRHSRKP